MAPSSQDEILAMLEETGAVDAEELAKFKADPEYFEQKMKESMDQMKEMLGDPDLLANAAQGMKAAQEMYNNPDALNDMMANIMKELSDEAGQLLKKNQFQKVRHAEGQERQYLRKNPNKGD